MSDVTDLVRTVARSHGLPDHPVARPGQAGVVNQVFIVGSGPDRYVLRTPMYAAEPGAQEEFAVEAWCAAQARRHGVPTPEVLAVGALDGVPYSIQEFAAGVSGETVRSPGLWRTMGEYAKAVAAIELDGGDVPKGLFNRFGRDLPSAWSQHLAYNLDQLDDDDPLLDLGVYRREAQPELRTALEGLRADQLTFGLSHGDLALRNLLVPGPDLVSNPAPPVLIDWGSASAGPAPHTDLLYLLGHRDESNNPDDDEIAAFAAGYGVPVEHLLPQLTAMRTLAALDLVRWARDRRRDRLAAAVTSAREWLARSRRG